MARKKAQPKPTHAQAVPLPTAQVLIRNGWVREQRDSLFADDTQTYIALTPDALR